MDPGVRLAAFRQVTEQVDALMLLEPPAFTLNEQILQLNNIVKPVLPHPEFELVSGMRCISLAMNDPWELAVPVAAVLTKYDEDLEVADQMMMVVTCKEEPDGDVDDMMGYPIFANAQERSLNAYRPAGKALDAYIMRKHFMAAKRSIDTMHNPCHIILDDAVASVNAMLCLLTSNAVMDSERVSVGPVMLRELPVLCDLVISQMVDKLELPTNRCMAILNQFHPTYPLEILSTAYVTSQLPMHTLMKGQVLMLISLEGELKVTISGYGSFWLLKGHTLVMPAKLFVSVVLPSEATTLSVVY